MDEDENESETRPRYAAHTPNNDGRWQSMDEHVGGVISLAEAFAGIFGYGDWGRRAGLLHDIGKYSDEFQQRLDRCWAAKSAGKPEPKERVDHKSAGAWFASREIGNDPMSLVCLGHHGGLYSQSDWKDRLAKASELPALPTAIERAKTASPELATPARLGPPAWCRTRIDAELFVRMVYSCLVDADSLDTEAHFNRDKADLRGDETPLDEYRSLLLNSQKSLMSKADAAAPGSLVNRVRREVYEACISAAALPSGVFRLTVPTGGGKTRSSLAFALEHARIHGMQRVIYAIPYTSIIDQTVSVFRGIFGEGPTAPRVLEHHSAVPEPTRPDDDSEMDDGRELWRRLSSENWDARIIVTTTVQLFESLFSNRPGRSRKVHRLAKAVVILDEVQTLPYHLLAPIVDALRSLCAHYGTTIVLCTATQPALEGDSPYLKGFENICEIVPGEDRDRHFRELKRVHYRIERDPWTWDQVAETMGDSPDSQCLAVVNTRKDALALLDALDACGRTDALHLSTLLCGAHRRRILEQVRRKLREGEPILLVSTQVVEAGVDLDFPRVLRAYGPLDRIVQAAGRCNREGKMEMGNVIVFEPLEGGAPPGTYRTAMSEARISLNREGFDLDDPAAIQGYFRSLFGLIGQAGLDEKKIQEDRKEWDYPAVAEKMRLIDDQTVPVLSNYDPADDPSYDPACDPTQERTRQSDIVEAVERNGGRMTRDLWRKAQPLMVGMLRSEFDIGIRLCIDEVVPEQLYAWKGVYDVRRGFVGYVRIDTGM